MAADNGAVRLSHLSNLCWMLRIFCGGLSAGADAVFHYRPGINNLLVYSAATAWVRTDGGGREAEAKPAEIPKPTGAVSDSPPGGVVQMADQLIERAVVQRASDIHIEPKAAHTSVRFRIDGDLHEVNKLGKETSIMLVSRLKALGGMDLAERRKPQDGAVEFTVDKKTFKLRLATTATPHGESMVIRLLEPSARVRSLQDLGMTGVQVEHMLEFASRSQGLVLLVGPTVQENHHHLQFPVADRLQTRTSSRLKNPIGYIIRSPINGR